MFGTALQGFLAFQWWQVQLSFLGAPAQACNSSLSPTPVLCCACACIGDCIWLRAVQPMSRLEAAAAV